MSPVIFSLGAGLFSVLAAFWFVFKISKSPSGDGRMLEISKAIQEGAGAYLRREYKTIGLTALPILLIIYFF